MRKEECSYESQHANITTPTTTQARNIVKKEVPDVISIDPDELKEVNAEISPFPIVTPLNSVDLRTVTGRSESSLLDSLENC
mmetsp:Transcript_23396/g.23587  ORF Transcript_23396/g.23587 Transcript_23396/m.23587 type:complete len:82 (+) Transcript_23396:1025-1270(+)